MATGSAFCDHEGGPVRLEGRPGGPLDGLTFAAKDLFDVAGHRCCCGNPDWLRTHEPATSTASAIERLVDAGATLVGKTLTDELAYSILGVNHWYGTPPNPAAPDRIPGGSSSGAASAAAAGDVEFAIGTDTGGSIRVPSSWCGLVGIRPTHGSVPLDHVFPLAPSFDTCGWLGRDGAIVERVGRVLLPDDVRAVPERIVAIDELWSVADAAVAKTVDARLGRVGTRERISVPFFTDRDDVGTFGALQGAQIHELHHRWIEDERPEFGDDVGRRLRALDDLTLATVAAAIGRQQQLRDELLRITAGALIAMPTTGSPAPLRSGPPEQIAAVRPSVLRLTCLASLAGLPQVNLPAGTVGGGPVGLSLIGPPGCDRGLLSLAARTT